VKTDEATSYGQIAKSTGMFAGTQVFTILMSLVRTKVLAVLLGTVGVGLAGLYQSVIEMVKTIAGMGLSFSAVKDIAKASSSEDKKEVAAITLVTRRLVWWTGLAGMVAMILFSKPISLYFFEDASHVPAICLLSFSVLFGLLSSGQMALLQGTRQLATMAKVTVLGSLVGLLIAVVFYLWLGIEGIVPALIAIALVSLLFSWYFSRRMKLEAVRLSFKETLKKGSAMIQLGFFNMLSGLVGTVVLLLMKRFMLVEGDMDMVGLYQAVWSISALYLGAILSAMSTDYFPRLCGYEGNDQHMISFANQQLRFVLVVVTPVVVAVLCLTPIVLKLLYAPSFIAAVSLMQWQIVGTFFKVLIWPVSFFLLAKGKGPLFLISEASWYIIYYLATVLLWPSMGLEGAGLAFLIAYLVYVPMIYLMVRPLCPFKVTPTNIRLMLFFILMVVSSFLTVYYIDGWLEWTLSAVLWLTVTSVAIYRLNQLLPLKDVWKKVSTWKKQ